MALNATLNSRQLIDISICMSNQNFEFQKFLIFTKNLFLLPYWQKFTIHPLVIAKKTESFFFKQRKKKVVLALSSKYFPNPYTSHLCKTTPLSYLMWTRVNVLSGLSASTLEFLHFIPCKTASECISIFCPKYLLPLYITQKKFKILTIGSPLLPLYLISYHAFLLLCSYNSDSLMFLKHTKNILVHCIRL